MGGGWWAVKAAYVRGAESDAALVPREENLQVRVLLVAVAGPRHLALLAVHPLDAVRKGLARPREEHPLAHRVAARQRLPCTRRVRRRDRRRREVWV